MENGDSLVGYEFETVETKKSSFQIYRALLYVSKMDLIPGVVRSSDVVEDQTHWP